MSAISGFCEKCDGFRKIYCDGDRNTCMSILFDTIEALQQENEQLRAQLDEWKMEEKAVYTIENRQKLHEKGKRHDNYAKEGY